MGQIYNISASLPFLEALANGVLERFPEPHKVTIYLPSKRAIRSLSEVFLRLSGKPAILLPNMQAVGDIDDDEIEFSPKYAELGALKPAISKPRRLMEMATLLSGRQLNLIQSMMMAKSLIKLIDEVQTKNVSFEVFENIIPEELASHWQVTLEFLKVAAVVWKEKLEADGLQEPIQLRNQILGALTNYYKTPQADPVIIAGTTGSIPATAELVKAIYNNPNGYVVLFGLDPFLNEDDHKQLEETHPQKALAHLLNTIAAPLGVVDDWAKLEVNARQKLISNALLPTHKIEAWQQGKQPTDIELIEAENIEEEAMAVAIALREALEEPAKTAMVVTTNRALAKRISAKMRVWDMEVNDSAGQPLLTTTSANFLLLLADMLASHEAPVDMLGFFKHPYIALELKTKIREIEYEKLHGPRQETAPELPVDFSGLKKLFSRKKVLLRDLLAEHIRISETLAPKLWEREGEDLKNFIDEMQNEIVDGYQIDPALYADFLRQMLLTQTYRPKYGQHKRVRILSPVEARLEAADVVIISGMNESSFPQLPPADSFMNQQIRRQAGLDLLEKRIGQAAHDFELLAQNKKLILTRSKKEGGSPTQKSRLLQRLEAVSDITPSEKYISWAAAMATPAEIKAAPRPMPKPPAEARPKELSATQVGRLLRDPYTIYAEKVLRLRLLDEIDRELNAADFGNFVHKAIEEYSKNYDGKVETLIKCGEEAFKKLGNYVGAKAFWWNKFLRIAHKFVELEKEKRHGQQIYIERRNNINIGKFSIKATADRVEVADGLTIIDYKTGTPPSADNIKRGLEPQLPIEALIFESEFKTKTTLMEYWHLKGTGDIIEFQQVDLKQIELTRENLPVIVDKLTDPAIPFVARPWSYYALKYNNYEHLERIKEWAE